MSSIPQRLYNQIMMLDDFTCVYCGKRTPDVQVDHIIPRSQGGPDVIHNLVAACPSCNSRKSDHPMHGIDMHLRFGRFARVRQGQHKNRGDRPTMSRTITTEERQAHTQALATERKEDGSYRYSAGKIRDIVGGNNAKVLSWVREMRPETIPTPKASDRPGYTPNSDGYLVKNR